MQSMETLHTFALQGGQSTCTAAAAADRNLSVYVRNPVTIQMLSVAVE